MTRGSSPHTRGPKGQRPLAAPVLAGLLPQEIHLHSVPIQSPVQTDRDSEQSPCARLSLNLPAPVSTCPEFYESGGFVNFEKVK